MREPALIRVVVVDDEPLARERVREILKSDPDFEVIAECNNGREAITAVRKLRPDLLILDVQMPGKDGFAVLRELGPENAPAVIFVTAYDQYAVQAFEVYALDYLLKPFDRERFEVAIQRAKRQITGAGAGNLAQRVLAALEEIKARPVHLERLVIKTNGHLFFLRAEEVDWFEAEGNYVRLHTGKESYLLRDTISALEAQLDPKRFIRVHRSAIINIERVQELQPWFHGEYRIVLQGGAQLTLSRSYREKLNQLLGKPV